MQVYLGNKSGGEQVGTVHLRQQQHAFHHIWREPRLPRHQTDKRGRRRHVHRDRHQSERQGVHTRAHCGRQSLSRRQRPDRQSGALQLHTVPRDRRSEEERLQLHGHGPGRPSARAIHFGNETYIGTDLPRQHKLFCHNRGRNRQGHRRNNYNTPAQPQIERCHRLATG